MASSATIDLLANMDERILVKTAEINDFWGYLKSVRCAVINKLPFNHWHFIDLLKHVYELFASR